ncbi:DUF3412 domain-containing protein, partial [Klebsiella pneumoniae]
MMVRIGPAAQPGIQLDMDDLLQGFVAQHRMKLPGGTAYIPAWFSPQKMNTSLCRYYKK